MKHARLLVLGIAIGAGLLAARMVISSRAPQQPAPVQAEVAAQPTVPVLIVTRDVKPGELIQPQDLKWADWPKDVLPAGAITRDQQPEAESSMAGQIAKAPLYNGEPLREQRLITAADGYMASVLPKGMRAIAVSVETETMAGGFILPGNKVDVILSRTIQGSVTSAITETILQNVRVLAIDSIIAGERDVKIVEPERTATLELSRSRLR
ncbi:Flp pilus assembly protein CpaB [Pannonibacter sp. Pt2-lr]